ncbi:Hypothetical predicted protein [Lecanosticta acicola]|uniref:Uncharacterized protein n=1 Tax=Lecanosticta acicola TaxID=111012 RepID=A0AAI8Z0I0_9PEZI|nr:Hypothetical predicted protein [Lecanosticta acicola]
MDIRGWTAPAIRLVRHIKPILHSKHLETIRSNTNHYIQLIIIKSAVAAAAIAVLAGLAQGAALESPLEKRCTAVQNVNTHSTACSTDPDNDPPSAGIAYDCGRGYTECGSATYGDPRTVATAPGEFEKCESVWDPYTEKYLRFEHIYAQCIQDWKNGQ